MGQPVVKRDEPVEARLDRIDEVEPAELGLRQGRW